MIRLNDKLNIVAVNATNKNKEENYAKRKIIRRLKKCNERKK